MKKNELKYRHIITLRNGFVGIYLPSHPTYNMNKETINFINNWFETRNHQKKDYIVYLSPKHFKENQSDKLDFEYKIRNEMLDDYILFHDKNKVHDSNTFYCPYIPLNVKFTGEQNE